MKPRRSLIVSALCSLLLGTTLQVTAAPAQAAPTDADLAYRWAPIHYQDSAASNYPGDYLAPVNYDGDWNTRNNWENLDYYRSGLIGTAYYSVVESTTHWFISYGFFHARDWKTFFPHENDMEGLLLTVRKDGSEYGAVEAMVTLAHDNFYSYVPSGGAYRDGRENIDGTLLLQGHDGAAHPTSFQEAKGHGCYNWDGSSFPGGDGLVYYPSRSGGAVPRSGNDRAVPYQLVDVFAPGSLWGRRSDSQTFGSWGRFAGDTGQTDAARAPWYWDDTTDGSDLQAGVINTDPAYLISVYFSNIGAFSLSYVRNPYRT
ncbi:hypothetical protein [Micromonospora sp. NPDC050200]|uniref:hypothetical protein n=1 Tax=Micromonospora sp. NPDC050200 TaxID=3155664 RepID=UPI0033DA72F1